MLSSIRADDVTTLESNRMRQIAEATRQNS